MATERDVPTLTLRVQLAPRGDLRWVLDEGSEPFLPAEPYEVGGWALPDDLWPILRRELPVALATWVHRLRRASEDEDAGVPLPRD